jgi:DNA recombination protein RmuC
MVNQRSNPAIGASRRGARARVQVSLSLMDIATLLPVVGTVAAAFPVGAFVAARFVRRAERLAAQMEVASAQADANTRLATVEAQLAARGAEVFALEERLRAADERVRDAQGVTMDERVSRAGLEVALREERERGAEKLALVVQARDELSMHFKALAGDVLEQNRKSIAEQQSGALDQILKPLGEKLVAFEKKVEETYDREAQQRSSLRQEVLNLQAATLRINEDARNLTLALKGEAKTRGNWGEVILERVLERSGLRRGQDYEVQLTMRDDEGSLSRPDVVVRLPDRKHVVIDAKVSLVAYDGYYAATDKAGQDAAARQHVDAMRRHVRALAEKNYQAGREVDSPDFVAMFVPIEPAFGLALAHEPDLFLDAWERKVVIVTPSTLLALLMTVQTLWQRDKQTRNAIEIAEQSGRLHDQFVLVLEALAALGKPLRDAQAAFALVNNRLVEGRGNLIGRIDKIKELGAKTQKQIPPDLVARAAEEDARAANLSAGAAANLGASASSKLTLVSPPIIDE